MKSLAPRDNAILWNVRTLIVGTSMNSASFDSSNQLKQPFRRGDYEDNDEYPPNHLLRSNIRPIPGSNETPNENRADERQQSFKFENHLI